MHGTNVRGGAHELFRKKAEDYLERAGAESNPEDRRIWLALALECLRFASGVRSF
jgi:hypothetical protein